MTRLQQIVLFLIMTIIVKVIHAEVIDDPKAYNKALATFQKNFSYTQLAEHLRNIEGRQPLNNPYGFDAVVRQVNLFEEQFKAALTKSKALSLELNQLKAVDARTTPQHISPELDDFFIKIAGFYGEYFTFVQQQQVGIKNLKLAREKHIKKYEDLKRETEHRQEVSQAAREKLADMKQRLEWYQRMVDMLLELAEPSVGIITENMLKPILVFLESQSFDGISAIDFKLNEKIDNYLITSQG